MTNVIPLTALTRTLPTTGGADMASTLFPDQTLLELILLVLDYHFDEDQEDMLNEMLKVMGQAEDTGVSKVETLIGWCDGILDPIVDEIEAAERAASMH